MTARRLAIAGSVVTLAMAIAVEAGAEDREQHPTYEAPAVTPSAAGTEADGRPSLTIDLERSSDLGAASAETVPPRHRSQVAAGPYRHRFQSVRLGRLGSARKDTAGEDWESIAAYAGVGRRALQLSMDLGSGDVWLRKEKRGRQDQLFLGMLYSMAPRTNLAVEYRALSGDVLLQFRHRF
jgi:hypothetical protein